MAKRTEKLYHPLRGDPGVAKTTPGGAFFKTGLATIQGPQPSNFENIKISGPPPLALCQNL